MTRQFFDWNEDNTARFVAMYGEGISFTLIAERIGNGLTGTAARKKASRLGLKGRYTTERKPMGPKPVRVAKPTPPKPVAPEAIGPIEDIADGCKFIADDPKRPGWRMCGHPGSPWCEYHAARVFEPRKVAA